MKLFLLSICFLAALLKSSNAAVATNTIAASVRLDLTSDKDPSTDTLTAAEIITQTTPNFASGRVTNVVFVKGAAGGGLTGHVLTFDVVAPSTLPEATPDSTSTALDSLLATSSAVTFTTAGSTGAVFTVVPASSVITETTLYADKVGEECGTPEYCSVGNSTCAYKYGNTGQKYCTCNAGYVNVGATNTNCYLRVTSNEYTTCPACQSNGGDCYSDGAQTPAYGCNCPYGRAGQDCVTNNIKVTCTNNKLTICITPFDDMATTLVPSGGGSIHPKDKGGVAACGFKTGGSGAPTTCSATPDAEWGLELDPLKSPPDGCGVLNYKDPTETWLTYESKLVYNNGKKETHFNALCQFQEKFNVEKNNGVGVMERVVGESGTKETALVTMQLKNGNLEDIAAGHEVFSEDEIFLEFDLASSSSAVYKAITVQHCTASSRNALNMPNAVTEYLVDNGCPATGQVHFGANNVFDRVGGNPTKIRTRLGIRAFRLPNSNFLYFHCQVKICQTVAACTAATCGGGNSYGRKKRSVASAGDSSVNLKSYVWVDRETAKTSKRLSRDVVSSPSSMMIPVAFIALVAFVAVVAVMAFGYKLMKAQNAAMVQAVKTGQPSASREDDAVVTFPTIEKEEMFISGSRPHF